MFQLTSFLALALCALVGLGLVAICLRHFELAVIMILLSPWVVTVSIPNSPEAEFYQGFGSFVRMGLLVLLGMAGVFYFLKSLPLKDLSLPPPFLLLAFFLLYCLASALYSIDPRYTVIRTAAFIAVLGFLLGFYRWVSENDGICRALNLFVVVFSGLVFLNFLSLVLTPSKVWWWVSPHRYQGLAAHPNAMGSLLMLVYPMLFWKYSRSSSKRQQFLLILLILIAVALHLLTGSRSTLLAALVGSGIWLVVRKKTRLALWVSALGGTILLAGFVVVGADHITPESLQRGTYSSGLADLTGRPELWAGSLFLINQRPFSGYGYAVEGSIWSDRRFWNPKLALWSGSARTSLHNGYLSLAVGLGWLGLALWLWTVLSPVWQFRRVKVDDSVTLILSIMSMCLVVNLVESAINGSRSITELTFWMTWALAISLSQKERNTT